MEEIQKAAPVKWKRRVWGAVGLLFGVVLPVLTIVFELVTELAADAGLNPFPTPLHVALVASVPLFNLVLLICATLGKGSARTGLHLLAGFAAAVALAFTLLFLPMTLGGLLLCLCFFWYFGLGLIGLLPTAPFFGLLTACILHHVLNRQAQARGVPRTRGFGFGWLAALLVGGLSFLPLERMMRGAAQAACDDPAVSAQGVQTLRRLASDRDMTFFLRHNGFNFVSFYSNFLNTPCRLTSEKRDEIYYRVTGRNPDLRGRRTGPLPRFTRWDFLQGEDRIGDLLDGLSLADSNWETKTDARTAIGYAEWTLVFANACQYADREARLRIDLPRGAVVSRVTLWINGEEREAAFNTRGKVREAYQRIVRAQRDPLLVTTCGPDQIQVQCFPVPRKGGTMKIRLGLTTPLAIAADGKSLTFPAPCISARNFTLRGNLPGFPKPQVVPLAAPPAPVAVYADKDEPALAHAALLQRLALTPAEAPHTVAVVVDTSASMAPHYPQLAETLKQLPQASNLELWLADDRPPAQPRVSAAGDATRDATIARAFAETSCAGGRDNVRPLLAAIQSLQKAPGPTALFWIHTPQSFDTGGIEKLAAALDKAPRLTFFLCPMAVGTCLVTERLRPSDRIRNEAELAHAADPPAALGTRFRMLAEPRWQASYEKVAPHAVPAGAVPANRHLARLWAARETIRTVRVGDPKTLVAAQQMALPWHIVTPVTGAVVLETARQYKENDLQPVDPSKVPTTPEPAHLLLFLLVLLVLAGTLLIRARLRRLAVR